MSRKRTATAGLPDTPLAPEWGRSGRTIRDYISGVIIKATPEEVDAVQVYSRRLVEDYGYSKDQIQTRPQFRVHARPSGGDPSFPVDIAVFHSAAKTPDNVFLIVECKRQTVKEGETELRRYLDMSAAELGVWFNGKHHLYLRKIVHRDGRRTYQVIPNIPRLGQRIEDVGLFARRDLRRPSNLKAVFHDIRNHLAGNTTGITRDEALAQEIINLLFCKIFDELNTAPKDTVTFRAGVGESNSDIKKRTLALFDRVKTEYSDVFSTRDAITLDAASIAYVVGELQPYVITEANRDAIGEAFEVFIGPALRGPEGQFFTPRNVVRMVAEIISPSPGESIIDPACGSGGFLITCLEHVWRQVEAEGAQKGWTERQIDRRKVEVASKYFRGIDKDSFLAKVTKAYMAIVGDGRGGVFCENSLLPPEDWEQKTQDAVQIGQFDIVVTNPPFGKKIRVRGTHILGQYDLGHRWKRDKKGAWKVSSAVLPEQVPHILFLERCLQLLKPGGRLGIVLPESILGNPSYEHIVTFLRTRAAIRDVITLPESLFKTSGKGGTHTKTCVIVAEKTSAHDDDVLFMSSVEWCGHDSRGNPTIRRLADGTEELLDQVPEVAEKVRQFRRGQLGRGSRLGFALPVRDIENQILVPEYYDPEVLALLRELSDTHDIVRVKSLLDDGTIDVTTGVEIGKMAYGTGTIPFIRTSDLSNWEIKADFKHGVSQAIYEQHIDRYKTKCDVQPLDIFMVRDGTYLIGTTAMVTAFDLPMLYQSHILKIRSLRPDRLSPWLLFVALNTPVVKKQIRAKQFTQDIIDSLGRRFFELELPIPKDVSVRQAIAEQAQRIFEARALLREDAGLLPYLLQGDEDSRDSAIALERLREVQMRADEVVQGTELEERLKELTT